MVQGKRILLLEGEKCPEKAPIEFLLSQGFSVQAIDCGKPIQPALNTGDYDLVLLNIANFDTKNIEISKKIRRNFVGPLLVLSGLNNTKTQLKAFELGADDFITTPIDLRILLARIHASLRRSSPQTPQKNRVQINNLTVDRGERSAKVEGQTLPLSTGEFDILWLLASHPKRLLSRDFLFVHALGRQYDGLDRAIDRRVSRLRKKLENRPDLSLTVRTVWGQGYMLARR